MTRSWVRSARLLAPGKGKGQVPPTMDETQTQTGVETQDREILEMLLEVDEQSARQDSRWSEKRAYARKTARIPCEIRFIGLDGESVLYTTGRTREISAGGLSFLSRQHFARRAGVLVTLSIIDGKIRSLSAKVVYSRCVREGWFLTGVQFGTSEDPRLDPRNYSQVVAKEVEYDKQKRADEEDGKLTPRRRMLQILAMASIPSQRTKGMVAKVVMASMSPDHIIRRASIPVLQSIAGREGVVCLISVLRDSNPVIQGEAAEALGMLGNSEALEPLQRLLPHRDDGVAIRAAEALARLGNWSGKQVVCRLLAREGPASRRAARALGLLVNRDFRPNAEGVEQARRYLQHHDV